MNRFPSKEEAELALENERQKLADSSAQAHDKAVTFGRLVHLAIFLATCLAVVVFWAVFIDLLGDIVEPSTLTEVDNTMAGIWLGLILAFLVMSLAIVIGVWRSRPQK